MGVEIRPNQLLIFGRGKGGPFLVKEAPLAGIDLPFKALAWENAQGKVWLELPPPAATWTRSTRSKARQSR